MNDTKPRLYSNELPVTDSKTIALYADQPAVDDLSHRIRDLLPGADKFSDAVLTAFAQISLAHNLDPFIGEVWIIPTKRGPRIRAGIEGHRKAAHKQSPYQLRQRPMTQAEHEAHGLQLGQIGAVTEIFRTDSRIEGQAYIPTQGYGVWSPGDNVASTKTPLWMAFKRSEQDALRKAFDLPFVSEENRNGPDQLAPVGPAPALPAVGSDPTPPGSARAAAADLYGDWDGEVFAAGKDDPPAEEPQEEIVETTATRIVNTETGEITDKPALDKWGRFADRNAAIAWGHAQGAFDDPRHAHRAYLKLRANNNPKNAIHMADLWRADVAYRLQAQAAGRAEALAS